MNRRELVRAIRETKQAIQVHRSRADHAAHAIHDAVIPSEPYVYALPIVAFLVGLRYADACAGLLTLPNLRTYGMFLLPLLKE